MPTLSYYDDVAHAECCSYCKRWLVVWKDGQARGTEPFDLAPRAGLVARALFRPPDGGPLTLVDPASAHCLRWPCRLRHWWKTR